MKVEFREGLIQKPCARCREWWPLERAFWWQNRRGWHSWCRACCNERTRELRAIRKAKGV